MTGHDELDCITAACGMWQEVLDQADAWAKDVEHWLAPEDELRFEMARMLASLSPQARALMADHLNHVCELVAHTHWVKNLYADANRSSA